jgi:hypothetical protein
MVDGPYMKKKPLAIALSGVGRDVGGDLTNVLFGIVTMTSPCTTHIY